MKQKNGKNISKKFAQSVLMARYKNNNIINSIINNSLVDCIDMIKKSSNIKEVLNNELFILQNFDINHYNKNEEKINNRVHCCNTAIEEYDLFTTDKKTYLNKVYQKYFQSKRNRYKYLSIKQPSKL